MFFCLLWSVWLSVSLPSYAHSQEKVRLKEVRISGNLRVEDDGIRLHLKSRAGEMFDSLTVEQDVKAIFRMGFFDDVQAELLPDGILTYAVKEKPYVREIKIQGASQVGKEKIETALGIGARTILDRTKVAEGVEKVRRLYNEQGYVNVAVDHAVTIEANNQAVITLDIVEGGRLLIKRIIFEGNKAFSDGDLRGLIGSKEEWIFSFLTSRGVLDRDMLTNDVAILSNHYNDHGYVEHKLDDPVVLRARDGLEVVFRITEGPQYRVGKVEIGGELIQDGQQMLHVLGQRRFPGHEFTRRRVRQTQACSVQRLPAEGLQGLDQFGAGPGGKSRAPTVSRVADQRMADMRQMHADLVGAAGFQLQTQQRVQGEALHHAVVRHCFPAPLTHREALAIRGMAADGCVHRAARRHAAMCDGEVFPLDLPRLQALHENFVGGNRACHHQQAAGVLVDAVHDA